MRITVVGGGSTYTPELVEGFARRAAVLPVDELVLHDVDAGRLRVVGGLAERILRRSGFPGRLVTTTNLAAAVEGAAAVLVQLRVGGQGTRLLDETIPNRFGLIGQETTGAGGFAKALRTVPVVLDIADQVRRLAGPDAWIVDFTNPVGIVTRQLLDAGHRAIGLCNVAIGFQRRFAKRFGVDPSRVQLEHVGLNHLTWERAIFVDGVDRLPELLATAVEELAEETGLPAELIRLQRAVPSYYLRYYYFTRQVLAELRAGRPRAEEVMEIERGLLEMYADPALEVKPKLLEQRGGAFYSEASAMLIESLHADRGDVQVVNTVNGGAIPNVAADAVVEVPCTITAAGARPLPVEPLAPVMHGLVEHAKAYERLTVQAAVSGDRGLALEALLANPLVGDFDVARPLLDALLTANREYLPRFFEAD